MTPTRKVSAAGIGGLVAIVAAWILTSAGIEVPGEVGAALGGIFSFAGGWIVRDAAPEETT
jgi:drug/metabolite transporter superfamily protein YnfA